MSYLSLKTTVLLSVVLWAAGPAAASDVVLNDGFELQDTTHWIETGNIPFYDRGVVKFDVTGNGVPSYAYYQHPGDGFSGGVDQTLCLLAGVIYEVSADLCYHSG